MGPSDMDREQREHYQVVIEAKDMAGQKGGLTGTTTVNISLTDVNDNPPRFTKSKYAFLFKIILMCKHEANLDLHMTSVPFFTWFWFNYSIFNCSILTHNK